MVFLPDGRVLIVERTGIVFIADPKAPGFPMEVYMKTSGISSLGETGIMSIALDQNWEAGEQHIYLFWTRNRKSRKLPEGGYISRFTHVEGAGGLKSTADFGTEFVLWQDTDGFASGLRWHYGGQLSWGPDARIYLSLGDKYSEQYQRSPRYHAGCVIRLEKNGTIPVGNLPSHIKPAACWAYGLRNGYRSSWDLAPEGKERMFIAETGGNNNEISSEDVHIGGAGKNYGWPSCEGHCGNPDFPQCSCAVHDDPVFTYPHAGKGAALIGGLVYRGTQFPKEYHGAYFYADFVQWWIKALVLTDEGKVEEVVDFHPTAREVISMAVDPDGNLWYTAFVTSAVGEIHRISYNDPRENVPPSVTAVAVDHDSGEPPLAVRFASQVADRENDALEYFWDFGNGDSSAEASPAYVYETAGRYRATLYVKDSAGNKATSSGVDILVGTPPTPVIISPVGTHMFKGNESIDLIGFAYDPIDGTQYVWSTGFVHDDHVHPMGTDLFGKTQAFVVPYSGHGFEGKTGIRITLTAISANGLSATTSVFIYPDHVSQIFSTTPAGLSVTVDGVMRQTPFVLATLNGFHHEIELPSQCLGHVQYTPASMNTQQAVVPGKPFTLVVGEQNTAGLFVRFEAGTSLCTPPLPNADLVLQLDAGAGIETDSENRVLEWNDQSWSKNVLRSTTNAIGSRPQLIARADGAGRSVVQFDGILNSLDSVGPALLPYGHSGRTIFVVAEYETVGMGAVHIFRQKFALEDAIGSHACSLEASMRVTNGIPLGCSLLLSVHTVNCVQTLKVRLDMAKRHLPVLKRPPDFKLALDPIQANSLSKLVLVVS
jgi:glucose/arabinose dehydrogenase